MRKLLALLCLLALLPSLAQAAITYVGASGAANAEDGGPIAPGVDGNTTAGDLIVCAIGQKNGTDYTILTSTGYTTLYGRNGAGGRSALAVIGKIATGSDSVSVDSSDNTSGRTVIGQCATFRGTLGTVTGIVDASAGTDNTTQADINTPALDVTVANSVVIIAGLRENQFAAENIAVLSGMDAEIGQPERTSSAPVGLIWNYDIQTTASDKSTSAFVTTVNTADAVAVALNLKEAATVPTWSVSPTVSAQDTNSYTLSYTASTDATFYAVACAKDSTAPTRTQVRNGKCTGDVAAIASVNEAVTGADTTVLGGSLTRPIHDLYGVLYNAAGDSTLATLADEMLDAPTGYGPNSLASSYTLLASVSGTSWIADLNATITPDVAAADVVKITTTTWPSAYAWTQSTDGNGSYTDPNGSRQYLTFDIYDTSAGDWMSGGPATLWFNNSVPVASNDGQYNSDADPLIDGVAMTTVDLKGYFTDADGDTLTCTSSDTGTGTGANKRPAGTTITDGSWAGTPTSTGTTSGSFTITCTDTPGDSDTLDVTWTVYDQVSVPDCDGNTDVDCALELAAVELSAAATYACSDLVASGDVVSQLPAASTLVNPFTVVDIVVSTGSCTGIDLLPTIYTATAVPSTAVYRGGAAFAQTGERYVTYFDADDVFYIGAIPYRNDGAMMICVDCAVVTRVRGIGLASTTAVVTATTCNPSTVVAGIPLNSDGAVCMTDIN